MKNLSRRLIAAGLAALLLGACATGRSAAAPRSGQPNFRSIYYFLVGTYHQNGADHATADALLRKAAAEDPRAQTISRQLLLNAIGRWQREDLSSAALRRELLAYQRDFGLDEELLHAAADLHEEEGDLPAAAACLNRLRELYPAARASQAPEDSSISYHMLLCIWVWRSALVSAENLPTKISGYQSSASIKA